jgi:hypothetical protein
MLKELLMNKFMTFAGAALLATGISSGAFAQSNPNAPEPNSTGTGVYQPGTSPTGQAIDRPQDRGRGGATGTTGSSKSVHSGMKPKDSTSSGK